MDGHIGPRERAAAKEHVPDESLYGRLAHQPNKEELLDHLRADGAKRGQAKKQLAEPGREEKNLEMRICN